MNAARATHCRPYRRGFTLLELLTGTFIMALLAAALYSVFGGALRLRESAAASIERELPASAALDVLRRDLVAMRIPADETSTTLLAEPMLGTNVGSGRAASDTLEFITAAGTILDGADRPWGDARRVRYCLLDPETDTGLPGLELVREVTPNLLAPTEPEPDRQRLAGGVSALDVQYFDGDAWLDAWDSTAEENAPPRAVRVRLELAADADGRQPPPLEFVCEIAAQPKAEEDDESSSVGSGGGS